jgi:hypothetical protein
VRETRARESLIELRAGSVGQHRPPWRSNRSMISDPSWIRSPCGVSRSGLSGGARMSRRCR